MLLDAMTQEDEENEINYAKTEKLGVSEKGPAPGRTLNEQINE